MVLMEGEDRDRVMWVAGVVMVTGMVMGMVMEDGSYSTIYGGGITDNTAAGRP